MNASAAKGYRVMKKLPFVIAFAAVGCMPGGSGVPQGGSPYQYCLPQAPPSEANRVAHPCGCSIVKPEGWTVRTIAIENFLKKRVADQFDIEGAQVDRSKTNFTVQRLGPEANKLYDKWLKEDFGNTRLIHTQFQGQPALAEFLAGHGIRRFQRETAEQWMVQTVFFERGGQWFSLSFTMKNADGDTTYYTEPVPIV